MEITTTIRVALEGKICTTPSGHSRLIKFYNFCQQYSDCTIYIDFTQLYWFDANLSALLQAILYKLNIESNLTFSFDIDLIKRKFPILLRNGFLASYLRLPDGAGSTVGIETFLINEDEKFLDYIQNDLFGNHKMSGYNCLEIQDHFLELFANIGRHARTTDPVFACGQYYPSQSKLYFTILDLGIGFLPPIAEYTSGEISTSIAAIEWAIKYNHSTKGKFETGGLGLYNLLNHCQKNGGQFNIITEDAFWGNNLGEMGTRIVPEFTGTVIHLNYNCK